MNIKDLRVGTPVRIKGTDVVGTIHAIGIIENKLRVLVRKISTITYDTAEYLYLPSQIEIVDYEC